MINITAAGEKLFDNLTARWQVLRYVKCLLVIVSEDLWDLIKVYDMLCEYISLIWSRLDSSRSQEPKQIIPTRVWPRYTNLLNQILLLACADPIVEGVILFKSSFCISWENKTACSLHKEWFVLHLASLGIEYRTSTLVSNIPQSYQVSTQ